MPRTADSVDQPIPKSYWRDQRWAFDHYPELVKRYEDRWVAVVNRRVVASSKSSVKAQERARAKTGRRLPIAVVYVETGRRIYNENCWPRVTKTVLYYQWLATSLSGDRR